MRSLDLDAVGLVGALNIEHTPDGIVPLRLPAWTASQVVDPFFQGLVRMPAGVRLELETDATELELDVMLTRIQMPGRGEVAGVFDLVVDDVVTASHSSSKGMLILIDPATLNVEFLPGDATTIRFDGLPGRAGTGVEVWLPHNAFVELRAVRVSDGSTATPTPQHRRRWIHYGSSISHCMEAEQPTGTWPSITARLAGLDLQNLAFAGQCMLDPFVARVIRDLEADVITLKVGINVVNGDTMRERTFAPALHGFLDTIREGHASTPIGLVTPIFCPSAEEHPGPTVQGADGRFVVVPRPPELSEGALTLVRIRQLIAAVAAARSDPHLHVFDGLELFGADDAHDLPDALHPNPHGYRRMGERFHAMAFAPDRPLERSSE